MRRNYTPPGSGHTREEIARTNSEIDALHRLLQPLAEKAYRNAWESVAEESAQSVVDEAEGLLRLLCREPDEPGLRKESERLQTEFVAALRAGKHSGDETSYIESRAADLARAVVGFWTDLGDDVLERFDQACDILVDLATGNERETAAEYHLIYSRFGVSDSDAWNLLDHLQAVAAANLITSVQIMEPRPGERAEDLEAAVPLEAAEELAEAPVLLHDLVEEEVALAADRNRRMLDMAAKLDVILTSKLKAATGERAAAACRRMAYSNRMTAKRFMAVGASMSQSVLQED